ncbi:hypothetical protein [Polyangium aurulentum]|uniref:hypothetical protein n=1 Tax=Polyangium aurulentum TaxID=2567896 RepID=UPI0010ADF049|nr:hypothetical protein [Polyangium aurulentum]UQA55591.1 hypothetical protein E8A73_030150 [Polyangium aurulentum]
MEDKPSQGLLDRDLVVPAAVYWAIALVQVIVAIRRHETFGAEDTIAAAVVVLGVFVAYRALSARVRQAWGSREKGRHR